MMDFKGYFQDELEYLKLLVEEFESDYPELKSFFSQITTDPDVNTLLESFAFLSAKLRQRIDDEFPEIVQHLLARVWPLPLRPLPATSIVQFTPKLKSGAHFIAKNAQVQSYKNVSYKSVVEPQIAKFRLSRDLIVVPIKLLNMTHTYSPQGSQIEVDLRWTGEYDLDEPECILPIFLGGETKTARLLKLWFLEYLTKKELLFDEQWVSINELIVTPIERTKENGVLPNESDQLWRLQLIPEFFSLPDTFNFIQLKLDRNLLFLIKQRNEIKLKFSFRKTLPENILIGKGQFMLNCVPVVNLFEKYGQKQPINQEKYTFPTDINLSMYKINSIFALNESEEGEADMRNENIHFSPITDFSNKYFNINKLHLYYSLILQSDVKNNPKWIMQFIDEKGQINEGIPESYFCCQYLAMNNDQVGALGIGDINTVTSDIPHQTTLANITTVTSLIGPLLDWQRYWEIISHLSLSPTFLANKTVIQEILHDFDIYSLIQRGGSNRLNKILQGIISSQIEAIDWLVRDELLRGLRLTVELDADCFEDEGEMYSLGCLLSEVFSFCIVESSFLRVDIKNTKNNEKWSLPMVKGSKFSI